MLLDKMAPQTRSMTRKAHAKSNWHRLFRGVQLAHKGYQYGKALYGAYKKAKRVQGAAKRVRTRTKYGNPARYVHADSEKSAEERSFTCVLHKPRKIYKPLGTWTYYQQQYGSLQNVEGEQVGQLITAHWSTDQFVLNSGTSANVIQFGTSIYAMNPYQAITNSTIYGATASPLDDIVHCKSVVSDLQITNLSTLATQVVLYWFVNKIDTQTNVYPEWNNCMVSQGLSQGLVAQPTAFSGAGSTPGLGYPDQSVYGTTPMASHAFRKQYRVLKKVEFMLDGAATEKIKYRIGLNKTVVRRIMDLLNGSSTHFARGISVQLMMIIRPTPVMVQENGTDVGVTIGTAKVGYTINSKYTFTTMPGPRTSVNRAMESFVHDTAGTALEKAVNVIDNVATVLQA